MPFRNGVEVLICMAVAMLSLKDVAIEVKDLSYVLNGLDLLVETIQHGVLNQWPRGRKARGGQLQCNG